MRVSLLVALIALAAGCGASGGIGPGSSAALRGLPPAHNPPFDLDDEDDAGRAVAQFEALPLNAPERSARRRELVAAFQRRIARATDDAEGYRRFRAALALWDGAELQASPVADLDLLAGNADDIFKRSSARGADVEAVTALAVLRAARPADAEKLESTWRDILRYTNELAVADNGPGAERSRAILMLEDVSEVFPSRWTGDKLIELYLARQEGVVKALGGGHKEALAQQRDPGVMRPVWNLIRLHARMRRLADAVPIVEGLKGQFGDEPELRRRLADAVGVAATATDGKPTIALMAAFVPNPGQGGDGDSEAALAICEDGAARMPQAVDPPKCAAEIARVTDHVPLAIGYVEAARRLAPGDRDLAEIAARLYLVRVADLLAAERIEKARERMTEIEAYYAGLGPEYAEKPLETSLADVTVVYGRGLTTQGYVDEGVRALEKARKLAPNPDVDEELASVALKTGRYADARRGFEAAAAVSRATPIETTFDGNRLRRLAGEAAFLAGDKRGAEKMWQETLKSWKEILGPQLNARARSVAAVELGRLHENLGERDASIAAFAAAVDADPEQMGVYGDVISFLVTRGLYEPAMDAYRRALGRPEVTEYLRAYTSIWLYDLAKLRGQEPDAATAQVLEGLAGRPRWYEQLSAYTLGKMTWAELLAKADTRGKRAEAYFYEAVARFTRGDRAGGRRFLEEVLATRMLGFFEYDMARYYLRVGVPGKVP